jgi:hypothetical protein
MVTLAVLVEWSWAWQAGARRHLAEHNGQLSVDWGIDHSLRWRNATEGLPCAIAVSCPFPIGRRDGSDAYGVVMRNPAVEDDFAAERALTIRFTTAR